MQLTFDPLSSWLNNNPPNPEIIQDLAKLINDQAKLLSAPRTAEALFKWFGPDSSINIVVSCWLKYKFPQMDSAITNEFVAMILERIAHHCGASGKFSELRELQTRCASEICEQCTPARPFLLTSSARIHHNLIHNKNIPELIAETFVKMEQNLMENIQTFQAFPFVEPSPAKRPRTSFTSNQLDYFGAKLIGSNSLADEADVVFSERPSLNDGSQNKQSVLREPSQLFSIQPAFSPEPSEGGHSTETSIRPTSSSSTKRFRTSISSTQQNMLMQFFQDDQNPSRRQMDIISSKVNLPKRVVQVWFQNARSRERRMFVKLSPHRSQSPKTMLYTSNIPTPPGQAGGSGSQTSPLTDLETLVAGATSANNLLDSTPMFKWQQIFNQILTQLPPLGMISTQEIEVPLLLPSQQPAPTNESESPLDLSTVSFRANGQHSPLNRHTLSPQTGSAISANETRSDNFCRRNRTSISSTQARFMQWFFHHHKTPTICECESIGQAIGLTRRVVQVWFQNQRAKEKKLARASVFGGDLSSLLTSRSTDSQLHVEGNECKLCNVKIPRLNDDDSTAITEHIFSKSHIDLLYSTICQGDSWSTGDVEKPSSSSPELTSE